MKNEIIRLYQDGYSYGDIADELGCAKSTVCYHLGKNQKEKHLSRQQKNRQLQHPYYGKIDSFCRNYQSQISKYDDYVTKVRARLITKIRNFNRETRAMLFSVEDVLNKFGENPKCYLTGKTIDIANTSSYHFDHIKPASKGGSNDIDNLGLCLSEANKAKSDMTVDELLVLCKQILAHAGYNVTKNDEPESNR